MEKSRRQLDNERFENCIAAGIAKHPNSWYIANLKAVNAARSAGLDIVKEKAAITAIILSVLDTVNAP